MQSDQSLCSSLPTLTEPRQEKTCLGGLQPGKTQTYLAQLQKRGYRGLRFQIQKLEVLY